jgi:hypothetical protein
MLDPVGVVICQHFACPSVHNRPARQKPSPQTWPEADDSASAPASFCRDLRPLARWKGHSADPPGQRAGKGCPTACTCRVTQDACRAILKPGVRSCLRCLLYLSDSGRTARLVVPSNVGHPVFVSVPSKDPHPQRRGMFVTASAGVDSELIDGIRVASAAETLLAVARDLSVFRVAVASQWSR